MNILFSIIAICAPIAIYWFIVRPRLNARFVDLYNYIDGFWARWWARVVAFRTLIIGSVGLILPELISFVAALSTNDLSALPKEWEQGIRIAALVATVLSRAMTTAPREEPPKG